FRPGDAWIFHAEFFICRKWCLPLGRQKRLRIGGEPESVPAAGQTDDGSAGAKVRSKKHDVFVIVLDDRRIVNSRYGVWDLGPGENRIGRVAPDDVLLHATLSASSLRTASYTPSYCCTIVSTEKHRATRSRHAARSIWG